MKRSVTLLASVVLLLVLAVSGAPAGYAQVDRAPQESVLNAPASCLMSAPNTCQIFVEPFTINLGIFDSLSSVTIGFSTDGDGNFESGEPLLYSLAFDQSPAVRPLDDYAVTPRGGFAASCSSAGRIVISYDYYNGSSTQSVVGAGTSELLACPQAGSVPAAVGAAQTIALAGERPWGVALLALLVLAAGYVSWRSRSARAQG